MGVFCHFGSVCPHFNSLVGTPPKWYRWGRDNLLEQYHHSELEDILRWEVNEARRLHNRFDYKSDSLVFPLGNGEELSVPADLAWFRENFPIIDESCTVDIDE